MDADVDTITTPRRNGANHSTENSFQPSHSLEDVILNGTPSDAARLGLTTLDRVGNTPLLRFDHITRDLRGVTLLGKAEWFNPGGSVKDRAASRIIAEGRRSAKFAPGKTLLDSTSGNTGIAYAMFGAAEGFPVTLCMPENVSIERKHILHAYGANIVYTDPADGSDGAIRVARELHTKHPYKYFYADQYSNDANWQAHYYGTANEIWQQTEAGSRISFRCSEPAEPS